MAKSQEISEDTKMLVTVLLLVFAYPVGLVMMFIWTKWPGWVKALLVIPFIVGFVFFFLIGGLALFLVSKGPDNMKSVDYNYSVTNPAESSASGEDLFKE